MIQVMVRFLNRFYFGKSWMRGQGAMGGEHDAQKANQMSNG